MSDNAIINSEKYWDTRFLNDWESNDGPSQSRFFSKLAIEHLPRWLLEQIRLQSLTLVDWGCAQGDGTDVWAEYFYNNRIVGVDFSSAAIEQATKSYPEIQFVHEDWLAVSNDNIEVFDVLFSSNTLEHFHKPYDKLRILCNRVKKAIILVLPFKDKDSFKEHFFSFMPENIPLLLPNSFRLVWSKVVDCSHLPENLWMGEQIFLVFADPAWVDTFRLNLCDINIAHNDNESIINALNAFLDERDLNIAQLERIIAERGAQLSNAKASLDETNSQIADAKAALDEINSKLEKAIMERDIKISEFKKEKTKYQDEVAKLKISFSTISQELNLIKSCTGWRILQYLWKIRVFVFPRGSRRERVGYKLMRYQRTIRMKLTGIKIEKQYKFINAKKRYKEALRHLIFKKKVYKLPLSKKSEDYFKNFKSQYAILCLPIIDWDFRFQRPQQIMRRFSKKGHEIFYVRQQFSDRLTKRSLEAGITEVTLPGPAGTNVYQTVLSHDDASRMTQSIIKFLDVCRHDVFICMVQLPFWEPLAELLRDITGCKVVYDCMDEHAGFSTNSQIMLDAEKSLVRESDLVVASSDLLFQKIKPLAQKSTIVRNAADFKHFSSVKHKPYDKVKGKIIGYYGAIADWFDSELVRKLASLQPDWNFVLIGSTFSAHLNPISGCRNIEILGEMPYEDLPKLIETWDCCIIPFKRTPLTEATNPVKMYEMLAAGKPVVSVGLPELKSLIEENLITIADDALSFAKAIEAEISNDSLEKREIRRDFAANNTWEQRQLVLDAEIRELFPLVSIIIVTFNNLALNRLCLRSVLNDSDYPNVEVIIVDNASTDGTPDYLEEKKSIDTRIKIILNSDNLGFASANNQGAAIARGEFLCFLNNDTIVSGSWLSTLVRHLQDDSTIGMIGPVTNAIGNEAQIDVGYEKIEDMPGWAKAHCRKNRGQVNDISMLAFFCTVIPKKVWGKVGMLDEQFGKGMFEDDDYNRRVRNIGLKIKLARDSFVHHWQKASFNLLGNAEYLRIYHENQRKYDAKWQHQSIKYLKISEKMAPLLERATSAPTTIIFAPSVGWAIQLAQRPHHLARALAREGYTVVFDVSNSYDNVDIIEEIEENLFLYNHRPNLLYDIDRKIVWTFTYNYNYLDYFPKETKVIYDWIDDITVFPYDQKMLTAFHDRALREADVILTVAKKLHMAAIKVRPDAIYLPNAVEKDLFDREPDPNPALQDPDLAGIINSGRPIAGYYGALADWFDYALLRQVADMRQDWEFVLIGVDYDGSVGRTAIRNSKNIHWIGPRDYYSLPGYLHVFDVAMIPFKLNDITVATSPLKLYEYFAGGKPVITTAMPECMLYREVCIVNSPNEFSDALDIAYESASDVSFREQLRGLASKNTWSSRAKEALNAIGSIDKQVEDETENPKTLKIINRFKHLRTSKNKHFFLALARHLSGISDDTCLQMYFEFALSANQRGQRVASLLNKRVKLKGKRYLDVGCAYGGFLVAFGERGAEPTGFDIEPSLIELSKFNFKDVGKQYPVHKRDVTKHSDLEDFQEAFNIITCNDVIEHVVDPQKAIHNIASMMRKDGIAYFEIPNCDAVEAVMFDGHYKLFGITQLSHNEASAYFAEHAPGTPYGVEHYLRLHEYRKIFDTAGLEFEIVEESLIGITEKSILEALESLQMSLPQRILSVPMNVRASVKLSIEQYLSAAKSAPRNGPIEKKEFMLNFGAAFWKIIVRKRSHTAIICGNNVVDLEFNNSRIPITPKGFKNHKFMEGYCNVCGKHSRFFFTDTTLFRESLTCEYCRTTSRYRSIARGLLTALESLTGIKARSIAELPVDGIDKHLSIYDTQPPFFYETCAYPIPDYFQHKRWIDLYLSSFKPKLPLGEKIAPGVLNQNLEHLTFSDESFDILITSDVMEHVRQDFSAHREIVRILKPGGIYLFTVPNFRDRLESFVRVLVHDPNDPSKDEFLTEPEYHGDANSEGGAGALSYRSYGTEIDEILNKLGFDVSFCKTDFPEIGVMNTELFYCIKR